MTKLDRFSAATWQQHASEWVALRDGKLVAAAPDLKKLYALLPEDPENYDVIAEVPSTGSFDDWIRRAPASQEEFRRRLRG